MNSHGGIPLSTLFPAKSQDVDYLINWGLKTKVIYVETPKVGCTSIKRILQYSEFDYDGARVVGDVHAREQSPLKSPSHDEAGFIKCLNSAQFFTFSFVRNPFSRVLSAYLDKIIGRPGVTTRAQKEMGIDPLEYIPSFDEFIDIIYRSPPKKMNPHWAPQTFLLGFENVRYDYLGRFEYFQASIDELVARTKLREPAGALSHGKEHSTQASDKLSRYYTPRLVKCVQEIYYEDFKHLGYGFSL